MTARQGCPPRPQGTMGREWAALLMRGPDNLLSRFPSILSLSPPHNLVPWSTSANTCSIFKQKVCSGQVARLQRRDTKAGRKQKSVTSAKMIASKYVWQLLFTVTVVTVHEIQPHFCLHWGRWAYSDSLAACQKLHSQLTFIVWICSTVGGSRLFGIMITMNLPVLNHLLFCHSFCCPFSIFQFSLFFPALL